MQEFINVTMQIAISLVFIFAFWYARVRYEAWKEKRAEKKRLKIAAQRRQSTDSFLNKWQHKSRFEEPEGCR